MTRFRRTAPVKQLEKNMPARMNGHDPLMGVRLSIETITPEIAQEYLNVTHVAQRKPSQPALFRYTMEMNAGHWVEPPFTFDPLAFTPDGQLVNGQHRLLALIASGKTLKFFVLRGVQMQKPLKPHTIERLPVGDTGYGRKPSFVNGMEDRSWHVGRMLSEIGYAWTSMPDSWIVPIVDALEFALESIPVVKKKTFGSAAIRAAFVWRFANPRDTDRSEITSWYTSFSTGDVDSMTPALIALWKHLLLNPPTSGRVGRRDMFVKTLYALDNPQSKITCRNQDTIANEFVADFRTVASLLGVPVEEL